MEFKNKSDFEFWLQVANETLKGAGETLLKQHADLVKLVEKLNAMSLDEAFEATAVAAKVGLPLLMYLEAKEKGIMTTENIAHLTMVAQMSADEYAKLYDDRYWEEAEEDQRKSSLEIPYHEVENPLDHDALWEHLEQ